MIDKQVLIKLTQEGFFNDKKTTNEIVNKLDSMGFTLKGGQISRLGQLLAQLCQDGILERERLPESEWKKTGGKFLYKKKEK
jgi:predicted transcriptional regulator